MCRARYLASPLAGARLLPDGGKWKVEDKALISCCPLIPGADARHVPLAVEVMAHGPSPIPYQSEDLLRRPRRWNLRKAEAGEAMNGSRC